MSVSRLLTLRAPEGARILEKFLTQYPCFQGSPTHHESSLSVMISFGRLGENTRFRGVPAYQFQSSISNRFCCTDISVFVVAAFSTNELFAISIRLIDIATIPAFLARVLGIDLNYDFSLLCSQILN